MRLNTLAWVSIAVGTALVGPGASSALAQQPTVEGCSVPLEVIDANQPNIEDELTIFDSVTIADLQVFVDVSHTFVGDLEMTISHNGTSVGLHAQGGGAGNDMALTFNDAGAPYDSEPFDCGCFMAPSGPGQLSDFDGQTSDGVWTLNVDDVFPSLDDGVLTRWCVRAFDTPPPPPPPALLNLVCSSTPGSGIGTLFWASTVSYDEYEVYVNGQLDSVIDGSQPGTTVGPLEIPSTVEVSVRGVTNGVASPPRFCTFAVEPVVDVEACASPGSTISDVFPVLSVLPVSEDLTIGDIQVQVDVSHTFIGDLSIDLSSPDRTTIRLHDQGGLDASNILLTYWEFGVPNGSVPYSCDCTMQPSGPGALTDFVGMSTQGLWRLFVVDYFLGDSGALNSWCLKFYENMPVFAVADLSCSVGASPGTAEVSWINSTAYDEVEIQIDGVTETVLSGPFAAGALSSYTTNAIASPQDQQICVIPRIAGNDGPPRCCALAVTLLPPQDIAVDPSGGFGTASCEWINPTAYDSINVRIDGVLVDQLSGDATTYTTPPVALLPTTFEITFQGVLNAFGSSPEARRNVILLDFPNIEGCSSPEAPVSDTVGPTVDTIFIPENEILLDLEVAVSVSHSFVGDLAVDLTSPLGTTVRLHDQGGGPASDLFVLYSDDGSPNGSVPTDCGCETQPAGLNSIGALNDFLFEPTAGPWSLSVTDNLELDDGTLHYWCLRVTDSCDLLAPVDVTCEVDNGQVLLQWNNSAPYTSIEIMRDDTIVAVLPASATSYLDAEVAAGAHEYRVVGIDDGKDCQSPSLACHAAFGITDLIVRGEHPSGLVDSVATLVATLEADGRVVQVVPILNGETAFPDESDLEVIWIALGTFPANRALTPEEGFLLAELHTGDFGLDGEIDQAPIPVFIESGDMWGFDPPTAFVDYDGVSNVDLIDDGDDSLTTIFGENTGLGLDFSDGSWDAFYVQDQAGIDYNDQLVPATDVPDVGGASVGVSWIGGDEVPSYPIGLFYQSSIAPVIVQSFESGGYAGDVFTVTALQRAALRGELILDGTPFRRGDFDADGALFVNDPIALLAYIFSSGAAPPCPDSADANDDGIVGIADPIYSLNFLFIDGPTPPAPGNSCGPDPTPDGLESCVYGACE